VQRDVSDWIDVVEVAEHPHLEQVIDMLRLRAARDRGETVTVVPVEDDAGLPNVAKK
jgi:hypothetical protein